MIRLELQHVLSDQQALGFGSQQSQITVTPHPSLLVAISGQVLQLLHSHLMAYTSQECTITHCPHTVSSMAQFDAGDKL